MLRRQPAANGAWPSGGGESSGNNTFGEPDGAQTAAIKKIK